MSNSTLRADVPLLDVRPGMHVEIVTTIATDPTTGEQCSLDQADALIYTGPVSGQVVSIRPLNPGQAQGLEVVLDTGMGDPTTVRTSRYNRQVTTY